jgi:hypothetical protein
VHIFVDIAHLVHMVLCLEFDECWMREYWVEVVLNWVVYLVLCICSQK